MTGRGLLAIATVYSLLQVSIPTMPSNSNNLPVSSDASETGTPTGEAVRTFEFDVSAGRPLTNADKTPAPVPTPKQLRDPSAPHFKVQPTARHANEHSTSIAISEASTPPVATRRIVRRTSWWATSLVLHALLLSFLAASTLVVMHEQPLELHASPTVREVLDELEDVEIEQPENLETLEDALATELSEPPPDAFEEELSAEPLIQEPTLDELPLRESASAIGDSALGELDDLFGADGKGLEKVGTGAATGKGPTMAKFFGTEVKARRILYMLDNSGGMRKGGKFEALVRELQASVASLNPKQKFYVVFYSDTVYPLFFPRSVRKFVTPNDRNRKTLAAWLDSVELCGGNAIDEALAAAEVIRPEVVFLLTDGDLFTTDKKRALLLNSTDRRYKIHTFGLGVGENTKTATGLKQVAKANGGTFRAVPVTKDLKELARVKERPYHSKKPGPVWGINVGKW